MSGLIIFTAITYCPFFFLIQTLTGKEIEIDIEPTDKVYSHLLFPHLCSFAVDHPFIQCVCVSITFYAPFHPGGADQGKSGGERRDPSAAAEVDLQWETDVRLSFSFFFLYLSLISPKP